jgi:hypothetical protein
MCSSPQELVANSTAVGCSTGVRDELIWARRTSVHLLVVQGRLATISSTTRWVVGLELVVVAGCLVAGFVYDWSATAIAVIAPSGGTVVVTLPSAVDVFTKRREGTPSARKARPILLPDTARYQPTDKPGWWFASCEWRIPSQSGTSENPAAKIMRANLRRRWHRRSIDAEPEMIQTNNDYLYIPFPPHYNSNPKDMPGRVMLIDNNEQRHHYKPVFRISRLLE